MSPDDIAEVTRIWQAALAERELLLGAVGERLSGSAEFRAERARWIVRAVSSLAPVLDHPTAFAPTAAALISLRFPLTLEELAQERDALLGALDERCGPLAPEAARAWSLAIELFAEIVSSIGLDPFGWSDDQVAPAP